MFNIFKKSKNERRLLVDRAQWLGNWWVENYIETGTETVTRILNGMTRSRVSQYAKKLDAEAEGRLFAEMLAFSLHYADRKALKTLGVEKRNIFMETLFETTLSAAAKAKKLALQLKLLSMTFIPHLNWNTTN
jgi:hypothetical protein